MSRSAAPQVSLTDTPAWSPLRRGAVKFSLAVGAVMCALPALRPMSDMVAATYIGQGEALIVWTVAILIGGASGERFGGWFLKVRGAAQGIQTDGDAGTPRK